MRRRHWQDLHENNRHELCAHHGQRHEFLPYQTKRYPVVATHVGTKAVNPAPTMEARKR